MKRLFLTFCILLPFVVYIFSILTQINVVQSIFQSSLPLETRLWLLMRLPLWSFSDATVHTSWLLLLNTLLTTLYVTLMIHTLRERRRKHVLYGLSGSFLSIFSIGCVACGALLSPLALFAFLGIPVALLGAISSSLSVAGSLFLLLGSIFLFKNVWRDLQ